MLGTYSYWQPAVQCKTKPNTKRVLYNFVETCHHILQEVIYSRYFPGSDTAVVTLLEIGGKLDRVYFFR